MKQRFQATRAITLHLTWRDRVRVATGWNPGFLVTIDVEHRPGRTGFQAAARLERGSRTRRMQGGGLEMTDPGTSRTILPAEAAQPVA